VSIDSVFDAYSRFIVKRGKILILVWILLMIALAPFALAATNLISYSVSVPASNKESQTAENLVSTAFKAQGNSNTTVYIVLEGKDVLAPQFYVRYSQLNASLFEHLSTYGLTNSSSIYSTELLLLRGFMENSSKGLNYSAASLNSTAYALHSLEENLSTFNREIYSLSANLSRLDSAMQNFSEALSTLSKQVYQLKNNLTVLNAKLYRIQSSATESIQQVDTVASQIWATNIQLYQLLSEVNQSAQLLYGVPFGYVSVWMQIFEANPSLNASSINFIANRTYVLQTQNFGGQTSAQLYYTIFYREWGNLTNPMSPSSIYPQIYSIGDKAVNNALSVFADDSGLNQQQTAFLGSLEEALNITDFGDINLLNSLTLRIATAGLSWSQLVFVEASFHLGPHPSQSAIDGLALYFVTRNLSNAQAEFVDSAFYDVPVEGLQKFVLNYLGEQLNQSDPQLSTNLYSKLNVSLSAFLNDAYDLGNPPNADKLVNATANIFSNALPKEFVHTLLDHFNLTSRLFIEQLIALGYPVSHSTLANYVVSVFSRNLSNTSEMPVYHNFNQTAFLFDAYSLGPNATEALALGLAVNLSEQYMTQTESENISSTFGLAPKQFLSLVSNLGSQPSLVSLENLTKFLFVRSLELNHPQVVHNVETNLNETLDEFIAQAYLVNYPVNTSLLRNTSISLVYRSILTALSQEPLVQYNSSEIGILLRQLYRTVLTPQTIGVLLLENTSFAGLPVTPTKGVVNQLVDQGRNATIITLSFSAPPSATATSMLESIVSSYNSTDFRTFYTSDAIVNAGIQSVVTVSQKFALPFGLAAAIVVAGLFFLSPVAALIPTVLFGVSALVGFGLIDIVLGRIEGQTLSFISPLVILILALGLVTDYSVLLLNRFRQELHRGKEEGVRVSTKWAGEAVFTSGLTVVLSYVVLSVAGIPLFSDVGSANVIVVSVILAASLTLLPPIMLTFGGRVFWPKRSFGYKPSALSGVTKKAVAKPKTVLAVLIVFTLFTAAVAVTLPVNINFLGLTPNSAGKTGLDQITNNFGGSTLVPTYVVIRLPSALSEGGNVFNQTELRTLNTLTQTIRDTKGVISVYGPLTPYNYSVPYTEFGSMSNAEREQFASAMLNYVSLDNRTVYLKVVFAGDPFGDTVLSEAQSLSGLMAKVAPPFYSIYVGGGSLDSQAIISYVFRVLPEIVGLLVAAIFVVLFIQLRSAFTPLRLIATILSSIAWTLFLVWLVFYKIGGSSVFVFAPLFLVTTMLGVGMDYDIFMIVRVREEVTKGVSDEEAIIRTAESTAGVITALGFILSSVFFALVLTQIRLLQQMGFTLSLGILTDTFVVWLIFVPSIMVLAKRLNWWPSDPRKERVNRE
jgi:RND superfamily putative drug exporter